MYKQNGHKEAINHLTILLESSPWSVQYLEARAECYEHRGMYDDAILDLRIVSLELTATDTIARNTTEHITLIFGVKLE